MDPQALSPLKISDGKDFLIAMESRGVDISAALWMYSPVIRAWRLLVISKDLDEKGPRYLLRQAGQWIAKKNGSSTFELFDVEFESTDNEAAIELASTMDVKGFTQVTLIDHTVNGITYPNVVIYRVRSDDILEGGNGGAGFRIEGASNGNTSKG